MIPWFVINLLWTAVLVVVTAALLNIHHGLLAGKKQIEERKK